MLRPELIAFLVTFLVGPLLVMLVLRLPARIGTLVILSATVIGAAGAAVWLQERAPLESLVAFWLGWVLAVAMVAQAVRRRMPGPKVRRWTLIVALMASTLPWFGFATAQMMV
ncbi:hypothetical protein [Antarctobacter jejuensis]|uniref:hypothetical protein n=1 Tax=Antarctobacter jejuensis TaxID=1439938 RepID=UPI003FD4B1FA